MYQAISGLGTDWGSVISSGIDAGKTIYQTVRPPPAAAVAPAQAAPTIIMQPAAPAALRPAAPRPVAKPASKAGTYIVLGLGALVVALGATMLARRK